MNIQEAGKLANKMISQKWVKWIHQGSKPAETYSEKKRNVFMSAFNTKHCASCLNLNGCCFVRDKSPESPLHERCHCYYEDIGMIEVNATSVIEKYTKYIFDEEKNKGKKALLESWGYTINDSETLKEDIEKQAQIAYQCGDYELDLRNEYGQRINTVINLKRKDTEADVSFVAGWMVYPNGKIVLITPYGG